MPLVVSLRPRFLFGNLSILSVSVLMRSVVRVPAGVVVSLAEHLPAFSGYRMLKDSC